MAGSPEWKVYDANRIYQAACKEGEAAACLAGLYGPGATIRHGHSLTVWREGAEEISAGDSLDGCTRIMWERVQAARRIAYEKAYGRPAPQRA